jgi:hypothetical protein
MLDSRRKAIPLGMNKEGWEKDTDARLCKRKLEQGERSLIIPTIFTDNY